MQNVQGKTVNLEAWEYSEGKVWEMPWDMRADYVGRSRWLKRFWIATDDGNSWVKESDYLALQAALREALQLARRGDWIQEVEDRLDQIQKQFLDI